MDTLYTFWDNITPYKTKAYTFWVLKNSATKVLGSPGGVRDKPSHRLTALGADVVAARRGAPAARHGIPFGEFAGLFTSRMSGRCMQTPTLSDSVAASASFIRGLCMKRAIKIEAANRALDNLPGSNRLEDRLVDSFYHIYRAHDVQTRGEAESYSSCYY